MKTIMNTKKMLTRTAVSLLMALTVHLPAWAQYVFVYADPYSGGAVQVGTDVILDEFVDGAQVAKDKGWSVEAKENDSFVPYLVSDEHDYVDLGLPSGTLWATCNVGAGRPQDTGLFFAWGDTKGHGSDVTDGYLFNWENYKWGYVEGDDTFFNKYCTDSSRGKDGFTDGKTELEPEDDAAYVNWGSQWRMPTYAQLEELRNECTWTAATIGDVDGYEVTGPNGHTIFMPETGWRIDDMLLEGGAYWSRSTNPESDGGAFYLGWDEWGWYSYGGRLDGQCVRPVVRQETFTVTIPASGVATFSADENVTLPEGLTAATCTEFDGAAGTIQATTLTQSVIPAATGVLVKGTPGETYTFYVTDDEAAPVADNALVAVTLPTHVAPTDGEYTHFMLQGGTFIRIAEADESAKMPANKAYLRLPTAMLDTDAPASLTIVWDETTGISHTQAGTDGGEQVKCYNLQGQRVAKPAKGIYVINRRKVIVK